MFWSAVHSSYFPLVHREYISGHQECRERHMPDGLFACLLPSGSDLRLFHSLAFAVLGKIEQR